MELVNKNEITSLELVEQINYFRMQEGKLIELGHNDLLKIIRDEFEKEISLGKISQSVYKNSRGKFYPMFVLTLNQAKQVLVRESKFVRRAIINYIEKLEAALKKTQLPFNKMEIKIIEPEVPTLYEQLKSTEKMIDMLTKEIKEDVSKIKHILGRIEDHEAHIKMYSSVLRKI